ncbi:MAG: hypothetical protein KF842_10340 [Caulobacter sp.]|nr:hypothetical protein [Caulobacter sp.]
MRNVMLAAAFLALPMTAPAGAQAQTAGMSLTSEFQAICLANRTNMSRSVAAAESRGYSRMSVPTPDGVDSVTLLTKTVGQARWAVVVGHGGSPARPGKLGQAFVACSITAPKDASGGVEGIKRWVGVAPSASTDSRTSYFFTEQGGRRAVIDADNDPAVTAALQAGGYYLLQLDISDATTIATLTQSTAAP